MNYFIFSLVLCCLNLFTTSVSAKTENELIQEYLKNLDDSSYDKRIAPEGSKGSKTPVDVNATMYILDITKVDEEGKYFDVQFYFRQSWLDRRLQYSNEISTITLKDVDKIWTPDLFFLHEREGSLHNVIDPNIFLRIRSNGVVLYSVRLSERLSCSMDLRKYPLDTQNCNIRIESYGFTRKYIELRWAEEKVVGYQPVGVESNITETDFDIIKFVPSTRHEITKFDGFTREYIELRWAESYHGLNQAVEGYQPVGVETNITETDFELIKLLPSTRHINVNSGSYSALELTLTLKRKTSFFVSRLYAPFIVLVLLSWLSLWMKAKERYLRVALLLAILYLMVTISTELNRKMPDVPYAKASDVWIGFCEVLVFAAFLEFIAVSIFTTRESIESSSSAEIELNFDPESKGNNLSTESLKSPLHNVMKMFNARRGGKGKNYKICHSIDKISRIIFPIIFILFNIVYWSVYAS